VAFEGEDDQGQGAIFVARHGRVSAVAGPFFTGFSDPTINNVGAVAFTAGLNTGPGGAFVGGAFVVRGGEVTTIATTAPDSPFESIGFGATINDSGAVAFQADLRSGGQGIFLWRNGQLRPVITTSGVFTGLASPVALNNRGTIAFLATTHGETAGGLFVGPDAVADKVIGIGDPLDGSSVTSLGLSFKGLNEAGQVVFRADLADGRQGYYVVSAR
jgi:hypothetical protein